jgi:endonuclease III
MSNLLECYKNIKNYVILRGFGDEIRWQEEMNFECVTETDFLRESAWVILCSGMNEGVIRKYFKNISFCFFEWESAEKIVEMKKYCIEYAMQIFKNDRKINAIANTAEKVVDIGFKEIKIMLFESPIETLQTFPFIGPITAYHLAKNLGLPFAKADRHLSRLSKCLGYSNVQNFCKELSEISEDTIQVVDIVLWRFATLRSNYINIFKENMV